MRGLLIVLAAGGCDIISGLSDFDIVPPPGVAGIGGAGAGGGQGGEGAQGGDPGVAGCVDTVDWAIGWTGDLDQLARGVIELPDGALMAMGTASGTIDVVGGAPSPTMGQDAWVARISAAGVRENGTLIIGTGDELVQALLPFGNGAIIAGHFTMDITLGTTSFTANGADAFGGLVDQNAQPISGVVVSRDGNQYATNAAVDPTTLLNYLAGTFTGDPPGGGSLSDGVDGFVAQVDVGGNVVWQTLFGGADDVDGQEAHGVAADGQGSLYVTGRFTREIQSPLGPVLPSVGGPDLWVAKLSAVDGALEWLKTYGSFGVEAGEWLIAGPEGVTVVGQFGGAIDIEGTNHMLLGEQPNGFVLGLDPAGALRFFTPLPSGGFSIVRGVAVDMEGKYLIAGHFTASLDFGDHHAATPGDEDGFLGRLSASGEPECLFTFGSAGADRGWLPTALADGVLIAGEHGDALALRGVGTVPDEPDQGALVLRLSAQEP